MSGIGVFVLASLGLAADRSWGHEWRENRACGIDFNCGSGGRNGFAKPISTFHGNDQAIAALTRLCNGLLFSCLQPPAPAGQQIQRNELLFYRDEHGQVQAVKSVADWRRRRAMILTSMQEIMGPLPSKKKHCPLDIRVQQEVDCGTYVRRLITYASEPGCRVPAYLLIPHKALAGKEKVPAVLCLHPTDNRIGHKVVVGLGGLPHRQYAQELAERGYVTLAPSYPLLANYQPDIKKLGYESGTMKAIWDNIRGVDLLLDLPFVKRGGVGVIGHSLGGHNALFTAVFDPRIKVIVSSCGLDSFLDYRGTTDPWTAGRGWTQLRYMPKLAKYKGHIETIPFDFYELVGALAPRPCLIIAPKKDANFQWRSVDRIVKVAKQVYRLYGTADHLQVAHPDSKHDFPDAMRQKAYQLLDRVMLCSGK